MVLVDLGVFSAARDYCLVALDLVLSFPVPDLLGFVGSDPAAGLDSGDFVGCYSY